MEPLIRVKNMYKIYNPGENEVRALDDVSLEINQGEFIAIVHGLSWLKKNNLPFVLYSDSRTAMAWVKNKKAKTKQRVKIKNEIT